MATKIINASNLKRGDIILSAGEGFVSGAVKVATLSRFSHAALYVGGLKIIEATDEGVKKKDLDSGLAHAKYAAVYRYPSLTSNQQTRIVAYAKKQKGKEYDLSGAIGSTAAGVAVAGVIPMVENYLSPEHDFYCSELVAFSYKAAGIKVTTKYDASQTTPADLERSKKLVYVGHLKVEQ